jgi:hypothetical protein
MPHDNLNYLFFFFFFFFFFFIFNLLFDLILKLKISPLDLQTDRYPLIMPITSLCMPT